MSAPSAVSSPLVGTWNGNLSFNPPGEDWSAADIVIQSTSGNLSGELRPTCCYNYPVSVAQPSSTIADVTLTIEVGTSLCGDPVLAIDHYEINAGTVTAFSASVSGRCPSTLTGTVRFARK